MNVNVVHYDDTDGDSITLGVHESMVNAQTNVVDRIEAFMKDDKRILYSRKSTKTTITFWVVDKEAASDNEGKPITMANLSWNIARENWIQRYIITQHKVQA